MERNCGRIIPCDLKTCLVEELTLQADEGVVRPIAYEIVPGSLHHDYEAYAAMEKIDYKLGREVWGAVILIDSTGRETCPYCFKTLHEMEGPIYHDCPSYILDLLPPTEDDDANLWRRACRDSADSILHRPGRGNLINFHSARMRKRGF
jgi:hypothetical protein